MIVLGGFKMDWIFFGHSHLAALEGAWSSQFPNIQNRSNHGYFFTIEHNTFDDYFSVRENKVHLSEALILQFENIIRNSEQVCLVLSLAGNDHSIIGLAKAQHEYTIADGKFVTETTESQIPAQILSSALIQAVFEERLLGVAELLPQITNQFGCKIVLVESPPPLASEKRILEYPGVFAELLSQYGVSDSDTRKKFWQLQNKTMQKLAAFNQVEFILNPAEIFDSAGYLAEDFCGNDPTHGNQQYGIAVLENIIHTVESGMGTPEKINAITGKNNGN